MRRRVALSGTSQLLGLERVGYSETNGHLAARTVLFVGAVDLRSFEYEAIRGFARRALASLATSNEWPRIDLVLERTLREAQSIRIVQPDLRGTLLPEIRRPWLKR